MNAVKNDSMTASHLIEMCELKYYTVKVTNTKDGSHLAEMCK